ncbi:MAG: hypothetical protein AB1634_14415 [Thermodesulfobacteriota bacterium]
MDRMDWASWRWGAMAMVAVVLGAAGLAAGGELPFLVLAPAPPRGAGHEACAPPAVESEHRPQPVRAYRLSGPVSDAAAAWVQRPTGAVDEAVIRQQGPVAVVSFPAAMGDGPMHGLHSLYVVDRQALAAGEEIRVAKWVTIHHSCGWGHAYKHDPERLTAHCLDTIPLEVVGHDLWDGNFHSDVRAGDQLRFQVLSFGRPVAEAAVRLKTAGGWEKEEPSDQEGWVAFQLPADSFPGDWGEFRSSQRTPFTVQARWSTGPEEARTRMTSTLVWRAGPARAAYRSRLAGLALVLAGLGASGLGVFLFRRRLRWRQPWASL